MPMVLNDIPACVPGLVMPRNIIQPGMVYIRCDEIVIFYVERLLATSRNILR